MCIKRKRRDSSKVNYTGIKLKDMTRKQLRVYRRAYYQTHREQYKKHLYRYRKRYPEKIYEIQKRYNNKNKGYYSAYRKRYYQEHKEYFIQWRKKNKKRRR